MCPRDLDWDRVGSPCQARATPTHATLKLLFGSRPFRGVASGVMQREPAPARQARMAMEQHQLDVEDVVNDLCFPSPFGATSPAGTPHRRHRQRPPHLSNASHASSYGSRERGAVPPRSQSAEPLLPESRTQSAPGPLCTLPMGHSRNQAQKPHKQAHATMTLQHGGARNPAIDQGDGGAPGRTSSDQPRSGHWGNTRSDFGRTSSGASASSIKGTPTASPQYDSLRSHSSRKRLWTAKSDDTSPLAPSRQRHVRRENVSRASSGGTLHHAASGARKHAPPSFPRDGSRERPPLPPRSKSAEPLLPETRTQSAPGPLSHPRNLPVDPPPSDPRGGVTLLHAPQRTESSPAPLEPLSRARSTGSPLSGARSVENGSKGAVRKLPVEPIRAPSTRLLQHVHPHPSSPLLL